MVFLKFSCCQIFVANFSMSVQVFGHKISSIKHVQSKSRIKQSCKRNRGLKFVNLFIWLFGFHCIWIWSLVLFVCVVLFSNCWSSMWEGKFVKSYIYHVCSTTAINSMIIVNSVMPFSWYRWHKLSQPLEALVNFLFVPSVLDSDAEPFPFLYLN